MKNIISVLIILLALSTVTFAQKKDFVAIGSTVTASEGVDSDYSLGFFSEGNFVYKRFLEVNGIATIEREPKAGVDGNYAIRLRPEVRYVHEFAWFSPFVGGGLNYTRQSNDQWSKAGFNWVGTGGVHLFERFLTVRASRIFTDRTNLNVNKVEGWRFGGDIYPIDRVRASVEYQPFNFNQPTVGRINSWSLTFRTGYVF